MTDEQGAPQPAPQDDFILDLATLHGDTRPLVVKLPNGDRCELRRREAMGPSELFLLDKVMRRIGEIGREIDVSEELSSAQDKRLRGMVYDVLRVLSPALAEQDLCFADKMAILTWYGQQARVDSDEGDAKNAGSA